MDDPLLDITFADVFLPGNGGVEPVVAACTSAEQQLGCRDAAEGKPVNERRLQGILLWLSVGRRFRLQEQLQA
eukprot:5203731-Prymnesium_polylepis.2